MRLLPFSRTMKRLERNLARRNIPSDSEGTAPPRPRALHIFPHSAAAQGLQDQQRCMPYESVSPQGLVVEGYVWHLWTTTALAGRLRERKVAKYLVIQELSRQTNWPFRTKAMAIKGNLT